MTRTRQWVSFLTARWRLGASLAFLTLLFFLLSASEFLPKPNVIVIVADDLGYNDTSVYGASQISTPNIDALAHGGVRLTDAHAPSAICSPTRYATLSGAYPARLRDQDYNRLFFNVEAVTARSVERADWSRHEGLWFGEGQVTMPLLFKSFGYHTAAIGKWHLGFGDNNVVDYNSDLKPGPLEIGFDYYFGTPNSHSAPPFVFVENHRVFGHEADDPIRIVPPSEVAKRGLKGYRRGISEGAAKAHAARPVEKIDLILAEKAKLFITQSKTPFFLYLAFVAPHNPIAPSPEFRGTSRAQSYGDYVQQLDASVGIVLDALEARGLADDTIVVFTSDNGGRMNKAALKAGHRPNGALLGQKTDGWEGGHRVPFIARWPGRFPADTEATQLFGLTDLMATLAAAVDIRVPAGAALDSRNQLSVLVDPARARPVRREYLMEGVFCPALRRGDWVYLPRQGSCGFTVPSVWGPDKRFKFSNSDLTKKGELRRGAPEAQLYNLATDPNQKTNVAAKRARRVARMQERLDQLAVELSNRTEPATH